jgi:hypothetical protein
MSRPRIRRPIIGENRIACENLVKSHIRILPRQKYEFGTAANLSSISIGHVSQDSENGDKIAQPRSKDCFMAGLSLNVSCLSLTSETKRPYHRLRSDSHHHGIWYLVRWNSDRSDCS